MGGGARGACRSWPGAGPQPGGNFLGKCEYLSWLVHGTWPRDGHAAVSLLPGRCPKNLARVLLYKFKVAICQTAFLRRPHPPWGWRPPW